MNLVTKLHVIRKVFFYLFCVSVFVWVNITYEDVYSATTYSGKVIKVTDGDSINILHEGKPLKIRLAEIDAPERGNHSGKNPEKPYPNLLQLKKSK